MVREELFCLNETRDTKGTDLNQAGIRYTGYTDTEIMFGRQRINHANQFTSGRLHLCP